MGKIIRDNVVVIILFLLGYLITFSGFAYSKYAELHDLSIRHDERIQVMQLDGKELKQDVTIIKGAVVELVAVAKAKKEQMNEVRK